MGSEGWGLGAGGGRCRSHGQRRRSRRLCQTGVQRAFDLGRQNGLLCRQRRQQDLRVDDPLQDAVIARKFGVCLSDQSNELRPVKAIKRQFVGNVWRYELASGALETGNCRRETSSPYLSSNTSHARA